MWICRGEASLQIALRVKTIDTGRTLQSQALVDSGATHCFIDEQIAILNRWNLNPLTTPVQLYNVDGTPNKAGSITHTVDLLTTFEEHSE